MYSVVDTNLRRQSYRRGDMNIARHNEYHEVYDILPDTLTLLLTAPRTHEGWGYLLEGEHVPFDHPRVNDKTFRQRAEALNPI